MASDQFLYIGVDPGKDTGFATYDATAKRLLEVTSTDFWGAVSRITEYKRKRDNEGGIKLCVVIEMPSGNNPVFKAKLQSQGIIQKLAKGVRFQVNVLKDLAWKYPSDLKVAQNIGGNKREADLLIEYVNRLKLPVITVVPSQSKYKMEMFSKITNWHKRCNQHGRDAAMLIFGRKVIRD